MFKLIAKYLHIDYHKAAHAGSHGLHAAYFGLLFVEGHTMYSAVGGLLFCFSVLDMFLHFGGE